MSTVYCPLFIVHWRSLVVSIRSLSLKTCQDLRRQCMNPDLKRVGTRKKEPGPLSQTWLPYMVGTRTLICTSMSCFKSRRPCSHSPSHARDAAPPAGNILECRQMRVPLFTTPNPSGSSGVDSFFCDRCQAPARVAQFGLVAVRILPEFEESFVLSTSFVGLAGL